MMTCNLKKDKTLTEREKYLDDAFTTAIVLSIVFQLVLFAYVDIRFYAIIHCLAIIVLLFPSIKHYTKRRKIIFFLFAPTASSLIAIGLLIQTKNPGIIDDIFAASKKALEIKKGR